MGQMGVQIKKKKRFTDTSKTVHSTFRSHINDNLRKIILTVDC